jgi:uncharacterized protein (DUF1501 family)
MKTNIRADFHELNESLRWLVDELKFHNYWQNVTLVVTSDFGRTLTPNSGGGSDHAWGGNYFLMGGAVKGGGIVGQYPTDLTEDGPLNLGRGRMLPTTSWDAVWNGISGWMGASTAAELDYCLPNRKSASGNGLSPLFAWSDLFKTP